MSDKLKVKNSQQCKTTVVLARLIGQFGLILRGETFDCAHSALVRATEKTKTVLDQKTEVE